MSTLPVVVLCGGLGMRLRPVVEHRPKVLASIEGHPYLHYLLNHLGRQGYRDVILSTGYLGEMVAAYAGDGAPWGVHLRYAREPEPLGTGGALRYAAEELGLTASFIAMNGDTFFSGALDRLVAFQEARPEAAASLALVEVPHADRYGRVRAEPETGALVEFAEKQPGRAGADWINAGVYVVAPAFVASIPAGRKVSLEREIFPRWLGRGLYGCPFADALFLDIGTPEDYARAGSVLAAYG